MTNLDDIQIKMARLLDEWVWLLPNQFSNRGGYVPMQ